MLTRIGLSILWLIHLLPARVRAVVGTGMGLLMMWLGRERRNVVDTNLALCFPDLSEPARRQLRRRHFSALGHALADTTVAWWSGANRLRKLVSVEGWEHLRAIENRPVIMLTSHFVGVDILALRLSIDIDAVAIFGHQKDPVFDRFLVSRRTRFRPIRLTSRQDGIKPVIRGLRDGLPLFFLPDMDYGARDAIFVPFFGVPAATISALPRLAAITGAAVVPVTITQLSDGRGYRVRFQPAWENFPGNDIATDTRRMNEFVEGCVREAPEQYYWVHKRFKTRPPGEGRIY